MKNDIFNIKYDLVISLGTDCACASYLNRHNLRFHSFPFDWLTVAPFENRISLVVNDFEHFLDYNDLKFLFSGDEQPFNKEKDGFQNVKTKFNFYHDFPANVPLEKSLPSVREKYNRRIKRFYKKIHNNKKILFIYFCRNEKIENNEIINAFKKLDVKFEKQNISLLILENKYGQNEFEYSELCKNVYKITYDSLSFNVNETLGNIEMNDKVFSSIKLSGLWKYKLSSKISKILTMFILKKELRRKYRKEFRRFLFNYVV